MGIKIVDCQKYPKSEHAKMPMYGVSWLNKSGRQTGNSWPSLAKAKQVAADKGVDTIRRYYVSGFLF